jgi:amino acid adenylation domain-containing protein/non-ribosomal peptide synthase protein (TIGR01720 family)
MFVFQKENAKLVDLPDLTISNYEIIDRNKAKFEITLSIVETSEGLIIEVNYAKSLYNKNTIVNIAKGYGKFLEEVLSDKNKRLSDICIFSQEKEKNVKEWNNVPHNYNSKNLLHTLFEEQVFKNPDKVAIDYHNNQLTFKEINVRANQLTQYLLSIKNTSNKLIGVCLWKTHEVLIPLIAILKSGSGYVPIDPEYPQDRIQSILQNSAVQIIITSKEFVKRFDGFLGKIICTEDKEKFSQYSEYNVNNVSRSANSIAYVIYTSGSTGKPKGVTINHNSVVNTINSINYKFSLTSIDKVLGLSSLGFDLSVYDFFGITAVGGTIVLPDRERSKDPAYWLDLILKHSITIWNSVPQLAQLIIDSYDFSKFSINSKNIIFLLSGDRIPLQLPAQIKQKFLNSNVISLGGATEGSIWSIWYDTQDLSNYNVNIPYGKSMPNQNMYILDRFGDHCDIGVIGDIYIGGKGLALGYYNMPMQTAEMFMANPFCIDKYDQYNNQGLGSRIYKTGDIGKYLPDGNIEYVGRSDFQVKVRGYRIELGEIENIITNVFGVRQSVVVVFENELKNKKLITYIVLDKERNNILESNIIQSIKNHCENFLPEYMRPNEIIVLDEMPLSGNGKIARDKLPKPEIQEKVAKYHSPLGRCEEALAEIWVLLLGLEKVGRNDNFFNLGGDSIISIQMVSRAKKAGIFFDIKQVFHTPTIIGLARNSKTKHIQQSSQKYTAEGKVKLLPIQEWFFKNFKNYNHFNQAFWFKSEGKIEIEKIKDIIQQIRVYHEAFRLRYKLESERWIGCYEVKVSDMFFETVDEHLTDYELSSIITNKQKSLDIKNGPIDSLIWVEGRGLLWIIHHLIIDGVSWRILLQDINDLWAGKELEEKSDNYKSWSEYLYQFNDFKTITKYYNHLSYHNLTYDSNLNDDTIKQQDVLFSKEITKSFLVEAHKAYNTQANDLLLLALLLSIGDVQGQYQITIMLEGHGRDGLNSNLDLTRSIGWFTTMFPVELKTTHANNLSASIKEVKEILRQIPDQGLGYGIANMKGQIKSGKVDVLFNYLGQLDSIDDESTKFKFGNSLVGETIGDKDLKYALEINGQIISKQLGFIWNYTNNPSLKTIKNIIAQFEKRFIQIIKHCTDQQDINYTPSDFSALDLDQAELDEILDNL